MKPFQVVVALGSLVAVVLMVSLFMSSNDQQVALSNEAGKKAESNRNEYREEVKALREQMSHLTTLMNKNNEMYTEIKLKLDDNHRLTQEMTSKVNSIKSGQSLDSTSSTKPTGNHEITGPKKNIFFDLGSNYGDTVLQFTGLQQQSFIGGVKSEEIVGIPKRVPGPWDIIMYEAHPKFNENLRLAKEKIEAITDTQRHGGPFHVQLNNGTAIGWTEGKIPFYLDTKSDVTWGSSILADHPDVDKTDPKNVISTPIHDLIKEIMKYRLTDYIIVKMDIEGIEYELVNEMLARGAMPYVDELYVEYHGFADTPDKQKLRCVKQMYQTLGKYTKIGEWQ